MTKRTKIQAGTFHVVGGGCFGSQYVRWLLRARKLGMVDFEKIIAVDHRKDCALTGELDDDKDVSLVVEDWIHYFSRLLIEKGSKDFSDGDYWVPSPLSPHILFLGFLKAAGDQSDFFQYELGEYREETPTPVRIPLDGGPLAISFAEWKCPVNCIEPPTCPAIHDTRTWDMKEALEGFFASRHPVASHHVFQCRHFVHGVGTIPLQTIGAGYQSFLRKLQDREKGELIVATVSGCHGLIGRADWQVSA